jgi:hypothetical protein
VRASAALLLGLAVSGAGCSSTVADRRAAPQAEGSDTDRTANLGKPDGLRTDGTYGKVPANGAPAPAAEERPRSVALPDSVELAVPGAAPALPSVATVAVLFVRAGMVARCDRALRRLDHELGREQGATVVALEPLGKDLPDSVNLDQVAQAAATQGAHLLLVDVRGDDQDAESTTFVVDARTRKFLAHTKPRASAPAGSDLVARLVVSARKPTP